MATNIVKNVIINVKSNTKDIKDLTAAVDKLEKENEQLAKSYKDVNDKLQKSTKQSKGDVDNLGKAMGKVGSVIAGAFAVDRLVSFGKAILDTRAEFQKLEAVLTNTLGSKSAAQASLAMIQEFASKTPFSVIELTQSFVKLVNQGFKPTQNELRKLGDLASSTGKSFDQLAEAIIDAQTGEFERLKEFGIRASKEGDNVTFTFKGVQKQVDFTSGAIQEYILGLGDLEGVSGSMAAISETLGGKISNLGDSWDSLLNTLGGQTEGIFNDVIGSLSDMLEIITELTTGTSGLIKQNQILYGAELGNKIQAEYDARIKAGEDEATVKQELINRTIEEREALKNSLFALQNHRKEMQSNIPVFGQLIDSQDKNIQVVDKAIDKMKAQLNSYTEQITVIKELKETQEDTTAEEKAKNSIAELEKQVKLYSEQVKEAEQFSTEYYTAINNLKDASDKLEIAQKELKLALDGSNLSFKTQEELLKERKKLLEQGQTPEAMLKAQIKSEYETKREERAAQVNKDFEIAQAESKKHEAWLKSEHEKELALEKQHRELIRDAVIDSVSNIASTVFAIRSNALQQQTDYELSVLKAQLESEAITLDEYENKRKEIYNEQVKRQKQLAIYEALLSGAIATAKIWAEYGSAPYVAAALTAVAVAETAAQVAFIESQPVPKFAKGGWVDGKPHSEGGTLIEAEKNEFIVNKKDSLENKQLLKDLNEGRIMQHINKNYVLPAIKSKSLEFERSKSLANNIAESLLVNAKFNDTRIVGQLDKLNRNNGKYNELLIEALKPKNRDIRNV